MADFGLQFIVNGSPVEEILVDQEGGTFEVVANSEINGGLNHEWIITPEKQDSWVSVEYKDDIYYNSLTCHIRVDKYPAGLFGERTMNVEFKYGNQITQDYASSNLIIRQQSQKPNDSISVSPSSKNFGANGGSSTHILTVSDNATVSVVNNSGWVTHSLSGNVLTLTAAANTGKARNTTITLNYGTATAIISVSQDACPDSISVSPNSKNFGANGGSSTHILTVSGTATVSVVNNSGWVTHSLSGNVLTLTAAANTGGVRNATITLNYGTATATISVSQDAYIAPEPDEPGPKPIPDSISVSPNSANFQAHGGESKHIIKTSNTGKIIKITNNNGWISDSIYNDVLNLIVGENNQVSGRSGEIKLEYGDAEPCYINVAQYGKSVDITVSPTKISFDSKGLTDSGQNYAIINTNAGNSLYYWEAKCSNDWIVINNRQELSNYNVNLKISVSENNSPEKRIGYIDLTCKSQTGSKLDTIRVDVEQQSASTSNIKYSYDISDKSLSFDFYGGYKEVTLTTDDIISNWIINNVPNWIDISLTKKTEQIHILGININDNYGDDRECYLDVFCGSTNVGIIKIYQNKQNSQSITYSINPTYLEFGPGEQTSEGEIYPDKKTIKITSNSESDDWDITTDVNWISWETPVRLNSSETQINIIASYNDEDLLRKGTITITQNSRLVGSISVNQNGQNIKYYYNVGANYIEFENNQSTKSIHLFSNNNNPDGWQIINNDKWLEKKIIKENDTTHILELTCSNNDTTHNRGALLKVLFSGTEYGLIYVLQKCNNVYKISSDTLNYQLYNTNILLGGQMKWDLVVGSNNDSLMVEDFHITPINDNIPYDKKSEDYLLNYSHVDNMSMFYKKIEGNFYNKYLPTELNHNWPILSDTYKKTYDDSYMMGCKRCKDYDIYKKQFEFLCPVWIEKLDSPIEFTISINDISNKLIALKKLKLDFNGIKYHDKFVKYFKEYITYLDLDNGNNELLNINLDKKFGDLVGVSVVDGNIYHKDISNVVKDLLSRERPVMEVDSMIMECFKNNKMISKQLFNFNICFNIEDIISKHISKLLHGNKLNIKVTVGDENGSWELVDFYNNYEYIPREVGMYMDFNKSISTNSFVIEQGDIQKTYLNVLDYLKDHKYINFIDKNKFSPMISHWSLIGNNDYIFNLYNGYCSVKSIDGDIIYCDGVNGNSPDIFQLKYSDKSNNVRWANIAKINSYDEFKTLYDDYLKTAKLFASDFSNMWVNGVKYRTSNDVKVLLIYIDDEYNYNLIKSDIIYDSIELNNDILFTSPSGIDEDNMVFFISNDLNKLTFKYLRNLLRNISYNSQDKTDKLYLLYNTLISAESPSIIYYNRSINIMKANGPSTKVSEIEYFKEDDVNVNILRYGGAMRPSFVGKDSKYNNIIYYKDLVLKDDFNNSKYKKYTATGYQPLYKSIDFCSINGMYIDYENEDKLFKSINISPLEYKWFNKSIVCSLFDELSFTIIRELDSDILLEDMIKQELSNIYDIDNIDELNHIYKLYEVRYNYDYSRIYDSNSNKYMENLNSMTYNIILKLK